MAQGYTVADAQAGAKLRSYAGIAVQNPFNPCFQSAELTAQGKRFEKLKAGLAGNPFGIDIAIAEADYNYQMSQVDIACPEEGSATEKQGAAIHVTMASEWLGRIEALLEKQTGRN